MKTCSSCKTEKAEDRFSKNRRRRDGLNSSCKDCKRAYYLANRERIIAQVVECNRRNPEATRARRNRHKPCPIKAYVRNTVARNIRLGRITRPEICSECNQPNGKIEAHHEDYSKPLEITWLCKRCHGARHRSAEIARDTASLVAELFPEVAA